jgi:hypothetical protein
LAHKIDSSAEPSRRRILFIEAQLLLWALGRDKYSLNEKKCKALHSTTIATIFIGNLSSNTNASRIYSVFEAFGKLTKVFVPMEQVKGHL